MAQLENRYGQFGTAARTDAAIDAGLRSYMLRVYNYMGLGVAFTSVVTLLVMNNPVMLKTFAGSPMIWILLAAWIGIGWFGHKLIFGKSTLVAHIAYWGYAGVAGVMLAPMVYRFFSLGAGHLVFRALAITAVTFGVMSLFGYVTKRNLSAFATFFIMAAIGLLIAGLVQAIFFPAAKMASLAISALVVIVFAGITAWETQQIKDFYIEGARAGDEAVLSRGAIFGAFLLYGTFVTLFSHILNILGIMRSE